MDDRVIVKEGQLEDLGHGGVEQAGLLGLVEPDAEIQEEGSQNCGKPSSFPTLARARRSGEQVWKGTWFAWVMLGVIGGTYALYKMQQKDLMDKGIGLVIAVAVSIVIIQVSRRAAQRSKPHR